ncbi:hypothetical protein ABEB36_015251 [Hypothenemus hampei]|uniref:THAP-type domain-containing protein n=1 Tax=Hypothenemus hampei TaxID=57062 RepID=A0ABD1E0W6_HYPHA
MVDVCSVCKAEQPKINADLTFHCLPKNPNIQKEWRNVLNMEDKKYIVVCSRHSYQNDYKELYDKKPLKKMRFHIHTGCSEIYDTMSSDMSVSSSPQPESSISVESSDPPSASSIASISSSPSSTSSASSLSITITSSPSSSIAISSSSSSSTS